MPVTRSTVATRRSGAGLPQGVRFFERTGELVWTLGALVLIFLSLHLVWKAKEPSLQASQVLNLNALNAREDLLPALRIFTNADERDFVARKIYYDAGHLSNVGALARIRVNADEIGNARGLHTFRDRMGDRSSVALLTAEQFRLLKPLFVVRTAAAVNRAANLYAALFFAMFLAVHFWWSIARFKGDETILPILALLTGAGLTLMISLRDPLRDNLLFVDFAQGVIIGGVLLAVLSTLDYQRLSSKLSFTPLLASFVLSVLLVVFGSGPGTSDAKVNLFGFQPVELIRILLVFFLAGYFATRWDVLRHARETRPALARFDIPPIEYTLPVLVSVALSVGFFFLQKDMGPALVFACLFLALYGVARGSFFVPAAGLALVGAAFFAGYVIGVPHTVGERVSMWLSPWNNVVHGGDQLAHSLWAFATGGVSGMGIGMGDPQVVPAAHTDLILAALGEEWGFLGVAAVFLLLGFLIYRAFRIAMRARSDYEFFLAVGLGAATAFQVLLIAAGALGLFPLSGVVTPFLSYGRTAMIANFAVVAILLSISSRPGAEERTVPMIPAARVLTVILGLCFAAVVGKAAYVQVLHSAAIMSEGTLVVQADGARRYQYNPRFQLVMREIPMGSIYDRNGLPLATSDWPELEKHRAEYQQLGINIDQVCSRTEPRHYPFGGLTFDLLGDLRTRTRWGATNTSFVERDSSRRLRGYDDRPTLVEVKNPKTGAKERVIRYDYRELAPLLRHRYDPESPEVKKVLDRKRDVRMSLDARLQVQVAAILRKQLEQAKQDRGASVVLDPATGDMLAAVSLPLPVIDPKIAASSAAGNPDTAPEANPYLDRARYGLYPPGSTFKVVTAMAAMRKDEGLVHKTYECIRLPDDRVGNFIKNSKRPIRDDIQDKAPHGTVDMERGITVSCNAYFAQLGTYDVGAEPIFDTANLLGIATAIPNNAAQLKKSLPQSSYGQGQVVASPFQMARVAATVANGGQMPEGRWITDETNARTNPPQAVLSATQAQMLGKFMREVVTQGTGRRAVASVPMAGKTGTAELADAPSHAWFIGFAPYGSEGRKIAVSVLVENGIYGGTNAAPAAAEIVNAAVKLGLIRP